MGKRIIGFTTGFAFLKNGVTKRYLVICTFFLFAGHVSYSTPPTWSSGYPNIVSGATSIDLRYELNSTSNVYYAVYNAQQSGITPQTIKNAALSGTGSGLVTSGKAANWTANTVGTFYITNLTSNATYYVYIVAESGTELMVQQDIGTYTPYLPSRQQGYTDFQISTLIAGYLMYFPEEYYKNPGQSFPLLIFLHGAGERSQSDSPNFPLLRRTGLPYVIDQGKDVPMIVASPQTPWSWDNLQEAINSFLEFLKTKYRIDINRIYVTGISAGGQGLFYFTNAYPNKVAAIVPVSTWPNGDVNNFLNIPTWAFMGSTDTHGALVNFVNDLNNIGGTAKYTEYPGGHSASVWNPVYDGSKGDDIYTWLLQYSKSGNQTPVVSAGLDQTITIPTNSVVLKGTASDADGIITKYQWTKQSGPAVTLSNAASPTLTATGMVEGSYVFRLTVTDDKGATAYDEVKVTVLPEKVNQPPVANAGSDMTITQNSITVSGTASDSDGQISNVQWSEKSGSGCHIVSPTKLQTEIDGLETGTYTFQLEVTDDQGASSVDKLNVYVSDNLDSKGFAQGIKFDFYELGKVYEQMPDFNTLQPYNSGTKDMINLENRPVSDRFAFQFQGYLKVSVPNTYTFTLGSDDGSQIFIDDQLIVNNDGLHSYKELEDSISLSAGYHKIVVNYFENTGSQILNIYWESGSMPSCTIGSDCLFYSISSDQVLPIQEINNLYSGMEYYYYEGLWEQLPDFNSLLPKSMGYTDQISLDMRENKDNFGFLFKGCIYVPLDGTYEFYLGSDDGSRFYMNNTLLIDNDGLHAYKEDSVMINLQSGFYSFQCEFFELSGQQKLQLFWKGPGVEKQEVPSQYFYYDPTQQITADQTFTLYPNPNGGNNFNIKSDQPLNINVQLTIVDSYGAKYVLSSGEISWISGSEFQINLNTSLKQGIYIIQEYLPNSGSIYNQTFVVQ